MTYPIIFEGSDDTGFSAYVPDLPGCVAAGDTLPEVRALIEGAIVMHLKGMRDDGEPIPKPSHVEFVEVA
jgi:predicted RNase H-like HicB family nuclease